MTSQGEPSLAVRLWRAGRASVRGYGKHGLPQQAAAISYRVLFSLVPLVALAVYLVDLALPASARDDLTRWVIEQTSGSPEIEDSVRRALSGVSGAVSVAGVIAILSLLWAASGMMSSIRAAFTQIWEADCARPFVRGKLLDLGLVLGAGVVALSGFAVSVGVRAASGVIGDVAGESTAVSLLTGGLGIAASLALTWAAFLALYRVVPPHRPAWTALWPAALVGALLFEVVTFAYGVYLSRFGDLSVVYGSLGALLGFLLVVYMGCVMLLLGAELVVALEGDAAHQDRYRTHEEDEPGVAAPPAA